MELNVRCFRIHCLRKFKSDFNPSDDRIKVGRIYVERKLTEQRQTVDTRNSGLNNDDAATVRRRNRNWFMHFCTTFEALIIQNFVNKVAQNCGPNFSFQILLE